LSNVFIHKILNQENKNLNEKISDLDNLKDRLKKIWIRNVEKDVIKAIKDAIFIIKDHYKEYIEEIDKSITKLKANANAKAKANANANAKANANANAKAKANANANAATLTAPTATPLGLTPLANSAAPPVVNNAATVTAPPVVNNAATVTAPPVVNNAAKNKATPAANPAANPVEIVSTKKNEKKPVNNNSSQIKPLSQSNEILYSDIITKLKKLRDGMDKKIKERFKNKTTEYNKQMKDPKIKKKPPIKPSLQGVGSEPVYSLITLFLIIQKLRGKLDNTSNNSTQLDTQLKILIKNYIYKQPDHMIFEKNKNKIKQIEDLKNTGSTEKLQELKEKIAKKKDSEIIKEFNEDIDKLFADYIEVNNGQYIIDLPQLKGSSNNLQSNTNDAGTLNQGPNAGGSRKKSKKSRS
jgi:hypothetical protein